MAQSPIFADVADELLKIGRHYDGLARQAAATDPVVKLTAARTAERGR
jgi:hypothetical protein